MEGTMMNLFDFYRMGLELGVVYALFETGGENRDHTISSDVVSICKKNYEESRRRIVRDLGELPGFPEIIPEDPDQILKIPGVLETLTKIKQEVAA